LLVLLIANVLAFGYFAFRTDPQVASRTRIEEIQIKPGRIQLLGSATRGGGQPDDAVKVGKGAAQVPCLEWAPFAADKVTSVERALERLGLPHPAIRRPLGETGGAPQFAYLVREPDAATVARIAEVQREFPGTQIKAAQCPAGSTSAQR